MSSMPLSAVTRGKRGKPYLTEPDVLEPNGDAALHQRPLGRGGYTERHRVGLVSSASQIPP